MRRFRRLAIALAFMSSPAMAGGTMTAGTLATFCEETDFRGGVCAGYILAMTEILGKQRLVCVPRIRTSKEGDRETFK